MNLRAPAVAYNDHVTRDPRDHDPVPETTRQHATTKQLPQSTVLRALWADVTCCTIETAAGSLFSVFNQHNFNKTLAKRCFNKNTQFCFLLYLLEKNDHICTKLPVNVCVKKAR